MHKMTGPAPRGWSPCKLGLVTLRVPTVLSAAGGGLHAAEICLCKMPMHMRGAICRVAERGCAESDLFQKVDGVLCEVACVAQ